MKSKTPAPKESLRVIKTARTEKAINKAALAGFRPLLKRLKPSKAIRSSLSVWQNEMTGEIDVIYDPRYGVPSEGWKQVLDWTRFYPHAFPEPFAAYLIPLDIQVGERVFVKDLIEDFIGMSMGRGYNFRLESCEAVWDGSDLKIQYKRSRDMMIAVG
jgi:hypothetical protein